MVEEEARNGDNTELRNVDLNRETPPAKLDQSDETPPAKLDQSDEGTPTFWRIEAGAKAQEEKAKQQTVVPHGPLNRESSLPRGGIKPAIGKKSKDDLYSMYETMTSYEDLTFRDFCGQAPGKKKDDPFEPNSNSVDFADGLAAVQTSLSSHTIAELPEATELSGGVSLRSPSMRESDHRKEIAKESGPRESVSRDGSTGHRDSLSRDSSWRGSARMANVLKDTIKDPATVRHTMSRDSSSKQDQSRDGATKNSGGGAPHTNYCSKCSKYVYVFKTRCLSCGKCYCSSCVKEGMGSMPEGRKCKGCLGRRFSERYIDRAGKGCFNLTSAARKAEIRWAKKKPKKASDGSSAAKNSSGRKAHNQVHSNGQPWDPKSAARASTSTPPRSPRSPRRASLDSQHFPF